MKSISSERGTDGSNAEENRGAARKKTLLRGLLVYGGESFTAECTIRNLSEVGARVTVSDASLVPDTFTLLEPRSFMGFDATVEWRKGNTLGLSFANAFTLNNKDAVRLVALRRLAIDMKARSFDPALVWASART